MAKNLLNELGVNYEVEEIDRRDDTDKLQDIFAKITSARTVSWSARLWWLDDMKIKLRPCKSLWLSK